MSPVLMSMICTSRASPESSSERLADTIFAMPSCSAISISLSPRLSLRKSIFCREYTSKFGCG
jgi:hypothetical protein